MRVCKVCSEQGLVSRLHIVPCSMANEEHHEEYYDETGVHHYHDFNGCVMTYSCSNGHEYSVRTSTGCFAPGCDFGSPEEVSDPVYWNPDKNKATCGTAAGSVK